MKIKAIEAIIKANKTIVIIKENGCQWSETARLFIRCMTFRR